MPADTTYDSLIAVAQLSPTFKLQATDEPEQAFLRRVVDTLSNEVTEAQWLTLTESARQWYDAAADEQGEMKPTLSIPDGYVPPAQPPPIPAPVRRRVTVVKETAPELPFAPVAAPVAPQRTNGQAKAAYHRDADGNFIDDETGETLKGIQLFNAKLAAGEVTRRTRQKAEKPEKVARDPTQKQKRNRMPTLNTAGHLIRQALTTNRSLSAEELSEIVVKAGRKPLSMNSVSSIRYSHLGSLLTLESMGILPKEGSD